jgi:cysteine rich repeat protein
MKTLLIAAAAGWMILLGAAQAQDFTAEQRASCKGDYDKFCKGAMPGGGRVLACLNKQRDQLSEACKKVFDAQSK